MDLGPDDTSIKRQALPPTERLAEIAAGLPPTHPRAVLAIALQRILTLPDGVLRPGSVLALVNTLGREIRAAVLIEDKWDHVQAMLEAYLDRGIKLATLRSTVSRTCALSAARNELRAATVAMLREGVDLPTGQVPTTQPPSWAAVLPLVPTARSPAPVREGEGADNTNRMSPNPFLGPRRSS